MFKIVMDFDKHDKELTWTNKIKYTIIKQHILALKKIKGMEHVPNIVMSFDKYLFLEVINILI